MSEPIDPRLAEVMAERDMYRKALQDLLAKYEPFNVTDEEIEEVRKNGVTFEQVMAEVEAALQGDGKRTPS